MLGLGGSCKIFNLDLECSEEQLQIFKQICIVKRLFWLFLGEGTFTEPRWKQGDQHRHVSRDIWEVKLSGYRQLLNGRKYLQDFLHQLRNPQALGGSCSAPTKQGTSSLKHGPWEATAYMQTLVFHKCCIAKN